VREVLLGLAGFCGTLLDRFGATTELFGFLLPGDYGDGRGEYRALRDAAGLVAAPWELVVEVRGAERKEFLQGLLTADVASLAPGRCVPAAMADRHGHWLADLWVLELGDRFWLRLRRDRWPALAEILEHRRISERVSWSALESGGVPLLLCGPRAREIWRERVPSSGPAQDGSEGGELRGPGGPLRWMVVREISPADLLIFPGAPASAGSGETGPGRSSVSCLPPGRAGQETPAPPPCGWRAFDLRRIEAGPGWFGLDGDEGRLVPEALPADRVSAAKGCYIGQETLARLRQRGKLNWRLGRLGAESSEPCAAGTEIIDENGSRCGWVTSAAAHPEGGSRYLGYVHARAQRADAFLRFSGAGPVSWLGPATG
jgi:folate-binding protein YgfZ